MNSIDGDNTLKERVDTFNRANDKTYEVKKAGETVFLQRYGFK